MDTFPPSQAQAAPSRKPFLVGGALVAAVLLAVGGWYALSRLSGGGADVASVLDEARSQADACPPENPGCAAVRVSELAARARSPEACELLQGAAYRDCVWQVAGAMNDPVACAAIEDEAERVRCGTAISLQAAFTTGDVGRCDGIQDAQGKKACQDAFIPPDCAQDAENPDACADQAATEKAIRENDASPCASIKPGMQRDGCFLAIANQDPDADGLFTNDELLYSSSPADPDTDGDGFKDGDEVAAGYDPNGPGKL